eukprot:1139379-Pelagomonas_calceolata.AAC.4
MEDLGLSTYKSLAEMQGTHAAPKCYTVHSAAAPAPAAVQPKAAPTEVIRIGDHQTLFVPHSLEQLSQSLTMSYSATEFHSVSVSHGVTESYSVTESHICLTVSHSVTGSSSVLTVPLRLTVSHSASQCHWCHRVLRCPTVSCSATKFSLSCSPAHRPGCHSVRVWHTWQGTATALALQRGALRLHAPRYLLRFCCIRSCILLYMEVSVLLGNSFMGPAMMHERGWRWDPGMPVFSVCVDRVGGWNSMLTAARWRA